MAYQPPIVATQAPRRYLRPTRALVVSLTLYVTIAVSYSAGYGQAMALMATTSANAARILGQGDYSEIAGIDTVVSPFVRLGISDASQFKPRNMVFGVFSNLWSSPEHYQLARQNASLVQVGQRTILPGLFGN